MDEVGVVKEAGPVHAVVVVDRRSACDQCKMGCKVTGEGAEIEALNLAHARVGQTVRVRMRPYTYLKGSLLLYGIPALALVTGAIVGRELLAPLLGVLDRDLVSALSGLVLCFVSFLLARIISSRIEKKVEYKPVIEEIL
ncbi:MAG: SoxR reducing system RseC family protein [Thermodesulfovibrionales bacterium]